MSWYLRRPAAAAAAPARRHVKTQQAPVEEMTQASGLFQVPQDVEGIPNSLHVYFSSFADNDADITYAVNRMIPTGAKQTVVEGEISVPAGGVAEAELHDVAGGTFEVNVVRPAGVLPSAVAIETFPADGATRPLITIPAGRFDTLAPNTPITPPFGGFQAGPTPGTQRVSSSFVAIPQGVAAQRPAADLLLSNFTGSDLSVHVTVNGMVEGSTAKEVITEGNVALPAFSGVDLPLQNVEGRAIEVVAQLPIGTMAGRLVEPSLSITETDTTDDTTDLITWLGPADFLPV
ncbi:MAG TPA: hypothetical protein VFK80_07320 [Limnochordia bacterium]|nr:hypothetical protein [Limnochordia bacterium]